jgi:hypothetical protein
VPCPVSLLRCARFALPLAALAVASTGAAVEPARGIVVTAGVGSGAELGLVAQKAGVAEAVVGLGWEHEPTGLRPEVELAIGLAPDGNLGIRPGVRWVLPEQPIQLRIAVDYGNARDVRRWRWLLVGGAFEVRWASAFSLFAGLDIGFPLGERAGLPLLLRGGAAFRF